MLYKDKMPICDLVHHLIYILKCWNQSFKSCVKVEHFFDTISDKKSGGQSYIYLKIIEVVMIFVLKLSEDCYFPFRNCCYVVIRDRQSKARKQTVIEK